MPIRTLLDHLTDTCFDDDFPMTVLDRINRALDDDALAPPVTVLNDGDPFGPDAL